MKRIIRYLLEQKLLIGLLVFLIVSSGLAVILHTNREFISAAA